MNVVILVCSKKVQLINLCLTLLYLRLSRHLYFTKLWHAINPFSAYSSTVFLNSSLFLPRTLEIILYWLLSPLSFQTCPLNHLFSKSLYFNSLEYSHIFNNFEDSLHFCNFEFRIIMLFPKKPFKYTVQRQENYKNNFDLINKKLINQYLSSLSNQKNSIEYTVCL